MDHHYQSGNSGGILLNFYKNWLTTTVKHKIVLFFLLLIFSFSYFRLLDPPQAYYLNDIKYLNNKI